MKAKATPKNKTSLRVGDILWSSRLKSCKIVELKVLSNIVIYIKLQYDNIELDCVARNSKRSYVAMPIEEYMSSTFYFFERTDAEEEYATSQRELQNEILGGHLKSIINILKTD